MARDDHVIETDVVRITPDLTGFGPELTAKVEAEVAKFNKKRGRPAIEVPLRVDRTGLHDDVVKKVAAYNARTRKPTVTVGLRADATGLSASVRAKVAEYNAHLATLGRKPTIKVELRAEDQIKLGEIKAIAEAQALAHVKKVKVPVEARANKSQIAGEIAKTAALGDLLSKRVGPRIINLGGEGIKPMSALYGTVVAMTPAMFAMASSATQASTSIAFLGASGIGAATGLATLFGAFKNVVGAMKQANTTRLQGLRKQANQPLVDLKNQRQLQSAQDRITKAQQAQSAAAQALAAAQSQRAGGGAVAGTDTLVAKRLALAKANQAVTAAEKGLSSVQDQQAASAAKLSQADVTLNDITSRMSKPAKQLYEFLNNQATDALWAFQRRMEAATLPGFLTFLKEIGVGSKAPTGALGMLDRAAQGFGRTISRTMVRLGAIFKTKWFTGDLAKINAENQKSFDNLADATLALLRPLMDIFAAAAPLQTKFTAGLKNFAIWLDNVITKAKNSGALAQWFRDAGAEMGRWLNLAKQLLRLIGGLFHASLPAGSNLVDRFTAWIKTMADWTNNRQGQDRIREFFDRFANLPYGNILNFLGHLTTTILVFKGVRSALKHPFVTLFTLMARSDLPAMTNLVGSIAKFETDLITQADKHKDVVLALAGIYAGARLGKAAKLTLLIPGIATLKNTIISKFSFLQRIFGGAASTGTMTVNAAEVTVIGKVITTTPGGPAGPGGPGGGKPGEGEPGGGKPAEGKPAEGKPVGGKPAEAEPGAPRPRGGPGAAARGLGYIGLAAGVYDIYKQATGPKRNIDQRIADFHAEVMRNTGKPIHYGGKHDLFKSPEDERAAFERDFGKGPQSPADALDARMRGSRTRMAAAGEQSAFGNLTGYLKGANDLIAKNSKLSADNSVVLQDYIKARKDSVQAVVDDVRATYGNIAAQEVQEDENKRSKKSLVDVLTAYGWSKKAAEDYATKIYNIPPVAKTVVETPGAPTAQERLKDINDKLAGIVGKHPIELDLKTGSDVDNRLKNMVIDQMALTHPELGYEGARQLYAKYERIDKASAAPKRPATGPGAFPSYGPYPYYGPYQPKPTFPSYGPYAPPPGPDQMRLAGDPAAHVAPIAESWHQAGVDAVAGFSNGIKDRTQQLTGQELPQWAGQVTGTMKSGLGEKSPSTITYGYGADLIQGLWNGFVERWTGLLGTVQKWITDNILGPLHEQFTSIGRALVGAFVDPFDTLAERLQKPVDAALSWLQTNVIDRVNTLLSAIGVKTIPSIVGVTAEQAGEAARAGNARRRQNRARGGLIPGSSPSPYADNIPAWLTANEYVQPVDAVRHYGVEFMDAVRTKKFPRVSPGYAAGGLVEQLYATQGQNLVTDVVGAAVKLMGGNTVGAIAKTIESMFTPDEGGALFSGKIPRGLGAVAHLTARMMAAVIDAHKQFPGFSVISGFRPGAITVSGNRSYHADGRATDWPPSMALFNFFKTKYDGAIKELIYSPAGGAQVWNGHDHMFSGAVRAQHWNHVHLALARGGRVPRQQQRDMNWLDPMAQWMLPLRSATYDRGGWLYPGATLAINNTGAPERVDPNPAAAGSPMRLDRRDMALLASHIASAVVGQAVQMDGRKVAEVVRSYDYLPQGW